MSIFQSDSFTAHAALVLDEDKYCEKLKKKLLKLREELSLTLGSKIESQMEDFAISIVPTKQIAFLELLRHILKKRLQQNKNV